MTKKLLYCLMLLLPAGLQAQTSFLYIQRDKKTPFYVKMDGKMLPRYGKNYAIIPDPRGGPVTLDILFQQNEFPAMHFTVDVPDNGFRQLMLNKLNDTFALYDLANNTYLEIDKNKH